MNEDFDQRLRARFATSDELPPCEDFGHAVRKRIARARLARRIGLAAAATAGAAVAAIGVPLLMSDGMPIAPALDALNGALGGLLASPAGFVLGAMAAAAALTVAFSD